MSQLRALVCVQYMEIARSNEEYQRVCDDGDDDDDSVLTPTTTTSSSTTGTNPLNTDLVNRLPELDSNDSSRFDVSHFNDILMAWTSFADKLPWHFSFFSFADVTNATDTSTTRIMEYDFNGLTWECEFGIQVRMSRTGDLQKKLVINLVNDGLCQVDSRVVSRVIKDLKELNRLVNKNRKSRWAVVEQNVWKKLEPFQVFIKEWFGDACDDDTEKIICYDAKTKRVAIGMRIDCVTIEFSFEKRAPLMVTSDDSDDE